MNYSQAAAHSLPSLLSLLTGEWSVDPSQATHVLYPSTTPPGSPSAAEQVYHRSIAQSADGKKSLIHVWYRPDSHDTWLPAADVAEPEPEPESKARWEVEAKWLRDGVRFNELMNEEDYEITPEEPTSPVVTQTAKKRELPEEVMDDAETTSADAASSSKKIKLLVAARPVGAVPIDITGPAASIPGKAYEREPLQGSIGNLPSELAPAPATADATMENGDGAADEADDSTAEPSAAAISAHHKQAAALAKRYLASQTQEIIIPSYSTWFSFNAISPLERRSLPEFFNGRNRSKTPEIYKEYRDFMINTYRLNPSEYLTFTACRRNLAGDVCSIMRVHGFLEQWGLINYQIDPESRPAALGPPFTGHFRVLVDTPRGLQPLHPGTRRPDQPAHAALSSQPEANGTSSRQAATVDLSLELRRTVYSTTLRASKRISEQEGASLAQAADAALASGAGAGPSFACDTCGSDTTRSRYHSIKHKDYVLCPGCYQEGRFPSSMFSGDFVRIDDTAFKQSGGGASADGVAGEAWSDAETLRLLEALEMYADDWNRVEEHVGTRSTEECIARFVQLPVEEPYLGPASGSKKANGGQSQSDLGPLQYLRDPKALNGTTVPFAQSDNPVMSVVAFLASAVSPAVASAAAQSALGELTDGLRKRAQAGEDVRPDEVVAAEADRQEKVDAAAEAAAAAAEAADGMDVDADPVADSEIKVNITPAAKSELAQAREDREDGADPAAEEAAGPSTSSAAPKKPQSAIPRSAVERAASIALGAAASKAFVLSSFEERECQRLVKQVLEAQMRKMELKMAQFEELESLLDAERRSLEAGRRELYSDRLKVQRQIRAIGDLMRRAQVYNAQAQAHAQQVAAGGQVDMAGVNMAGPPPTNQEVESVQHMARDGQGPLVREVSQPQLPPGGNVAQL